MSSTLYASISTSAGATMPTAGASLAPSSSGRSKTTFLGASALVRGAALAAFCATVGCAFSASGASVSAVSTTAAGALLFSRFAFLRSLILCLSAASASRSALASSIPGSNGFPDLGADSPEASFASAGALSADSSGLSDSVLLLSLFAGVSSLPRDSLLAEAFLFFLFALLSLRSAFASAMPGSTGEYSGIGSVSPKLRCWCFAIIAFSCS